MAFPLRLTWLLLTGLCLDVGNARACSFFVLETFFESGSAEIRGAEQTDPLESFSGRFHELASKVPVQCIGAVVYGYQDSAEATMPGTRMDASRAEAVRKFLVEKGGLPKERIELKPMGDKPFMPTGNAQERQNRVAATFWKWGEGRWRCDPESATSPPICGRKFRTCYLELTDGTVCNFDSVRDPNPTKYSVDHLGQKLD